ncbi:MAG: TonB-dependent receptor, partial [Chitinophagaceae bacterium]|nr:TonB-dependent receptor [Chitinophagaceae bacterium]
DEFSLSKSIKITIGTKVLHNVYTGVEIQPSGRIALNVDNKNTLWASVSRAVRTPSRVDVDYFSPSAPQPPTTPSVAGGSNFISEKVLAYELGYRVQPNGKSTFSLSTFYNVYRDIYSLEPLRGTQTYVILNGTEGKSWGAEFSGTYQLHKNWRLRGGYTWFDKKLTVKPGHVFDPSYLSNDAQNQFLLQSMCELPLHIHLDVIGRYLDYLPATVVTAKVPAYSTFDIRIAYTIKIIEVSIVGQNLSTRKHVEFNALSIPRSFYAKMTVRL